MPVLQAAHSGDAADEVLRVTGETAAPVIVIGLQRRSPVGRLVTSSDAQRILLNATQSVLAVKPASRRGWDGSLPT